MNTPSIELASVPGLSGAQGLFGSITQSGGAYNDGVVAIMVYVYDVMPPEAVV